MRNWFKGVAISDKQIARQQNVNTNDRRHEFLVMFLIHSSREFVFYDQDLANTKGLDVRPEFVRVSKL